MVLYAVVLVRGLVNADHRVKDALKSIRLTRINHCSLVSDDAKGTLQRVKDFITWGEVDEKTLAALIEKRGKMPGDKPVTIEEVKKGKFASIDDFAKAIVAGKAKMNAFGMKVVFRLHPPKSGHRYTKIAFPKGALGPRKGKINELLSSMM